MATDSAGEESSVEDSGTLRSAEKRALTQLNQRRLEDDLNEGRLSFESRPRVVELQLTNFCNMSCIMCYDGNNPPLERLDPEVVRRLASEVMPTASVLVPFATSEPLITTWPLTLELARDYGVELEITTNVQFLDRKKCEEMEPHVTRVIFSIDCHIPEVFEAIRLKSKPDRVFENLPAAARYFRSQGIEVVTNIVYMMEAVPYLDETVRWLADHGIELIHIQKLLYYADVEKMHFSDPLLHLSSAYTQDMKARLRRTAAEKEIALIFDFDGSEVNDHRRDLSGLRPSETRNDWLETLRRRHPGYCPQSVNRLKVDSRGNAYPCCVGGNDQLKLGNINEEPFEDIWNGPTSRDLRRAMLTGDYPSICRSCNFRRGPELPEQKQRPFGSAHFTWMESHPQRWVLKLLGPDHMTRAIEPPTFSWSPAPTHVDYYEVVFSLGGEEPDFDIQLPNSMTSFRPPDDAWARVPSNQAYWWTVYGIVDGARQFSYRGEVNRCVIRHEAMERIEGSCLSYDA